MGPELRHLRYFVVMAEELNFTRAARRLHLAQQALSASIRQLEEQLGVQLFHRTTRNVELSTAGRILLEQAPGVLAAADRAFRAPREAAQNVRGQLLLRHSIDAQDLADPLLRSFAAAYPDIDTITISGLSADNLRELDAGRADAALVWAPEAAAHPHLRRRAVQTVHLAAALPAEHALGHHDAVPLEAFARERIVLFPRQLAPKAWDSLVAQLATADGGTPQVANHAPGSAGQAAMLADVVAGAAVTLVAPALFERLSPLGLVMRPLHPPVTLELALVTHENPPLPVRALIDHAAQLDTAWAHNGDL